MNRSGHVFVAVLAASLSANGLLAAESSPIVDTGQTKCYDMRAEIVQETAFLRGDSNADGIVDISDAVAILFHLFMAVPISCRKAADTNDDGAADISDAVHLLGYLFLGGKAPDRPSGTCGSDPTPDELTCDSFAGCR